MFKELARTAGRRADQFNVLGLTNMVWAFATVGKQDLQLFAAFRKAL